MPPALAEALLDHVVAVRDGRPGAFLCHIHCAFGAQPLADGLAEIAAFLDANPDEVVTLIIQDEIPAAEVDGRLRGEWPRRVLVTPTGPDAPGRRSASSSTRRAPRRVRRERGPAARLVRQRLRGDAGDAVPVPVARRASPAPRTAAVRTPRCS